ncbi:MAG: DNA glycosylase [Alphaproteobacteria bacterium CG11_big_fil_rev_8_21_14_0_20_44_7]|nr:MAG: DNA glycosylase [Alphaproteobacteria bacterium CG11_big_fil_rev_8_21_14_0_20_44_7]
MADIPALKWLREAGVDEIAGDTPRDFFAESAIAKQAAIDAKSKGSVNAPKKDVAQRKPILQSASTSIQSNTTQANSGFMDNSSNYAGLSETIESARKLAEAANNLDELRKAVEGFDGCSLKKTANKTVFCDGNPETKVMLIGEAPGADEDRQGIPFCGMSGQLLDKVLKSIGLDRESGFYITNTIFWRPPGNRKPTPEELAICKPFLEKHIALVAPKILLLVGATAVQAILQDNSSMSKLRSKQFKYKNDYMDADTEVMVTYHPSYLMRSPLNKRLAWEDMLLFEERIKNLG